MLSPRSEIIWLLPMIIVGSLLLRFVFLAELPPEKKVENFCEAEDLKLLAGSSVQSGAYQDTRNILPGIFVGGGFVWYATRQPGDKLLVELPIEQSGRYNLELFFAQGGDFGIVDLRSEGTTIASSIDLFAPGPSALRPIRISDISLRPKQVLEILVTSKNEQALPPFYQIGLDGIRVSRADH